MIGSYATYTASPLHLRVRELVALVRLHVVHRELPLQLQLPEPGAAGAGDGDGLARKLLQIATGLQKKGGEGMIL